MNNTLGLFYFQRSRRRGGYSRETAFRQLLFSVNCPKTGFYSFHQKEINMSLQTAFYHRFPSLNRAIAPRSANSALA